MTAYWWLADGIVVDALLQGVWRSERFFPLPPRGFRLLRYFIRHPQQIIPIEQLLQVGWPDEPRSALDLYPQIYRIRCTIEPDYHHPTFIVTRRGAGYILRAVPQPKSLSISLA
jgi:DNA-binding response OmpR family regulator